MECETCQQMSVETVVEDIAHIANWSSYQVEAIAKVKQWNL